MLTAGLELNWMGDWTGSGLVRQVGGQDGRKGKGTWSYGGERRPRPGKSEASGSLLEGTCVREGKGKPRPGPTLGPG